jgi:acyl carrier protein
MSTREFDSCALVTLLTAELIRIRPHLIESEISIETSLTQDLGLDSFDLEQLFAFIKANVTDVDLTPWLLASARKGSDSLDSLATFLAAAPRAA